MIRDWKPGIDIKKHFYVSGPDEMVKGISEALKKSGTRADSVVIEK